MQFDVTVILALSSFLSPIVVAGINNYCRNKRKKLDLEAERRNREQRRIAEIYDTYALAAGACLYKQCSKEALAEFGAASAKAMLYAPRGVVPKMKRLEEQLESRMYDGALSLLCEIIEGLRTEVRIE